MEAGQIRVEFVCREVGESMMGRVHELGFVRTRELRKTRSTTVRASHENVTLRFCNRFSVIPSCHAFDMCSKSPGIKLESVLQR